MDDRPSDPSRAKPDLAAALRTARAEDAERTSVIADLRTLAMARLAVLRDALEPVLAQLPDGVDLFDVGVMPGDPPRLFIDMIAFVELSRDRRTFRFVQDRRHGRVLLAEVETLDAAVDAVTVYIARRLVERDKALAADEASPAVAAQPPRTRAIAPRLGDWASRAGAWTRFRARNPDGHRWSIAGQAFWFVVEVLGLLSLFALLFFALRGLL